MAKVSCLQQASKSVRGSFASFVEHIPVGTHTSTARIWLAR